jgi:hypothetical protein
VENGNGKRFTREGRDGELKLAGRDDDSKESVLINIDERMGSQVLAEVYTTRIRGLLTENDIRTNEGRISFPRWVKFFVAGHEWRVCERVAGYFRINLIGRFGDSWILRSEPLIMS